MATWKPEDLASTAKEVLAFTLQFFFSLEIFSEICFLFENTSLIQKVAEGAFTHHSVRYNPQWPQLFF